MIRSEIFTITRTQLMRAASMQYFRRMWPVIVAFPIFGLTALFFGPNPLMKAIGIFAIAWPMSIPGRGLMATRSQAKRLMRPTWVSLEEGVLYFHAEDGGGMKMPLDNLRQVERREGCYVLETQRFSFALVPIAAISDADRAEFEGAIGMSR